MCNNRRLWRRSEQTSETVLFFTYSMEAKKSRNVSIRGLLTWCESIAVENNDRDTWFAHKQAF